MSISNQKQSSPNRKGKSQSQGRKSNLPLILVGGGVILVLLAAGFIYLSNQSPKTSVPLEASGSPALKVVQDRIDFGDVKVDTPVTATFELSNVGDQPLRFSQVPKVEVVEGC